MGDRKLSDFSNTIVVIDEKFDEELTGPIDKTNLSVSQTGNKRDKSMSSIEMSATKPNFKHAKTVRIEGGGGDTRYS